MDPYVEACRRLDRARVPYVAVGVFAINLYASRAGAVMTTADCDLLLPADAAVLGRAVKTLRAAGFEIEAGNEPLPDEDPAVLSGIVRSRANVRAVRRGAQIDLALSISGSTFLQLWRRHRQFRVEGVRIRVGALLDLIRSKERAGRPKDRLFLETYRSLLGELLQAERRVTASSRKRRPRSHR